MNSGSPVSFENVSKRFRTPKGTWYQALAGLDFEIKAGEFVSLVGPTGCGKSTALTLLAGLEQPSIGSVKMNGKEVTEIDTSTGFVFQHDATFPWMNVYNNIAAGPKFRGVKNYDEIVRTWIGKVGLTGFESNFPHQLSGGMKKRVALAQALINEPSLLLMDEPFGALDTVTRKEMQMLVRSIYENAKFDPTIILVTHSESEAVFLSNKIIILDSGPATIRHELEIDLPLIRENSLRFTSKYTDYVSHLGSLMDELKSK